MSIILFGFKGSGKSYFGKRAAIRMGWTFIDTDELIEEREGISCREISMREGEERFRLLETEVISSLNKGRERIIAVGGGAVLREENREILQKMGELIYLKVGKEVLEKRIFSGPFPSFLDPLRPKESFEAMYQGRLPLYEALSERQITIFGKSDDEVLEEICNGK